VKILLGVVSGRKSKCPSLLKYAAATLLYDILSFHTVAEKVLHLNLTKLELGSVPDEFPENKPMEKERSRSRSKGKEKKSKKE
jgi:hypothetical protein